MLSSSCSHRLILSPCIPKVWFFYRPRNCHLLTRNTRNSEFYPKFSKHKWKISCLRDEDIGPTNPKLDNAEKSSGLEKSGNVKRGGLYIPPQDSDGVSRATGSPWVVPWTAETILQVMLLWAVSFWFIGSWVIPNAARLIGISMESPTSREQALYSLVTDATGGLAGIAILHQCLSRFRPLPSGWFQFTTRGIWLDGVSLGCFMFPLAELLSEFNLHLLPTLPSTPVTPSSVEQSIAARDPVAMALYAVLISVWAPVWEEVLFRGFLLPSLTRYMSVWCAILVSSVVFALAHFNVHGMLPLIFLGVVKGLIFVRTRNLLPTMLLHSLWNGFVFLDSMR